MLFVLVLDGAGYFMAVGSVPAGHDELVAVLEDIFVVGRPADHQRRAGAARHDHLFGDRRSATRRKRLTSGTLRDFSLAMAALGRGDLDAAHASVNIVPVKPNSRDELGEMAESFNVLQEEVRDAALGLDEARENMRTARAELIARHEQIAHLAHHDPLTDLPNRTRFRRPGSPRCSTAPRATATTLRGAQRRPRSLQGSQRRLRPCRRRRAAVRGRAAAASVAAGDASSRASAATNSRSSASEARPAASRRSCWPSGCSSRGRTVRDPRPADLRSASASARRVYPNDGADADDAARQRRRRALPRQGRRPPHRPLLRSRHGPPPARALRAAASTCARRSTRNELRPALPAAGEDRWRGLRLRGARPLAASETRPRPAGRLHPARRAERHDRRDRRMGAARGLPRGGVVAARRCRSASTFRRCSSATAISPASCISILLETGLAPGRLELEITEGVLSTTRRARCRSCGG